VQTVPVDPIILGTMALRTPERKDPFTLAFSPGPAIFFDVDGGVLEKRLRSPVQAREWRVWPLRAALGMTAGIWRQALGQGTPVPMD
jgi:hypothetical protein